VRHPTRGGMVVPVLEMARQLGPAPADAEVGRYAAWPTTRLRPEALAS
jgi:hypothetical protein